MGLEASEWCWGSRNAAVVEWHLVSWLIKTRQLLLEKISSFTAAVSLKGRARAKAGFWVIFGCQTCTCHLVQLPQAETLKSLLTLCWHSLVVCASERGRKKRNWKENEQRGTILKRTQIYSICTFPSFSSMENSFTFPALCVKPQRWLAPKGTHQPFPPAHVWSCSHLGLNFNPLVQADELHESSSADSSWLSSFCLACFIVWALNVPALPSAHTFGFWLTRGLRQRDSICHLESSMTWSQVVTQIPQTVHRIDHKFLQ